ncbi:expressed unknown protein [Seminavis robusta]|uniref:Uncharacterized protein n=1 Tax=Seminavis robusta TaxID=568900 RepID=A0A9N8H183_9STRA|nr:expressed unknown protein [Seminavis robusta]|eukprot:Sro1_g000260.1 n/a (311) ;mRNA; r:77996-79073
MNSIQSQKTHANGMDDPENQGAKTFESNSIDELGSVDSFANESLNELMELKSTLRTIKWIVVALFGSVILVSVATLTALVISFLRSPQLSSNGHLFRMTTTKGAQVGTVGIGQTFRLPIFTLPVYGGNNALGTTSVHPHACVDVPSVKNVWRSVFLGITTNVIVSGVYDGRFRPDASISGAKQYGAALVFQGSIQNRTHTCLNTMDKDLQICVNFANPGCRRAGEPVEDASDRRLRQLTSSEVVDTPFNLEGIDEGYAAASNEGGASTSFPSIIHHRLMTEECTGIIDPWCQDFAALELVGPWQNKGMAV